MLGVFCRSKPIGVLFRRQARSRRSEGFIRPVAEFLSHNTVLEIFFNVLKRVAHRLGRCTCLANRRVLKSGEQSGRKEKAMQASEFIFWTSHRVYAYRFCRTHLFSDDGEEKIYEGRRRIYISPGTHMCSSTDVSRFWKTHRHGGLERHFRSRTRRQTGNGHVPAWKVFECCKIQRCDLGRRSLEGVEGWIYIDDGLVYGMVVHSILA